MDVMGMKVSKETMVYCLIAFLLGYFFRTFWSNLCRCKSVEGWAVQVGGQCQDNSNWGCQADLSSDSYAAARCYGTLSPDVRTKIEEKYDVPGKRAMSMNSYIDTCTSPPHELPFARCSDGTMVGVDGVTECPSGGR